MKRVLIITYYWPPTGGSGVQRWLKFAKYLPEFGWEPVIYTPSNPEAIVTDNSLEKEIAPGLEVIKRPIMEPYDIYRFLTGKKKSDSAQVNPISDTGNRSFKSRFSLWIRANVFIPDPRVSWVRPSVHFLKKYMQEHPVDLIVSTGPPQSMHLLARNLKRATGVKWVADFRDPWTKIFYFKHLPLMSWAARKHACMEASVIREADEIVTVTRQFKEGFLHLCDEDKALNHFHVIPNGYDESDMNPAPDHTDISGNLSGMQSDTARVDVREDGKFCLTHTGLFSQEGNPHMLWEVLDELAQESEAFRNDLRIRLIGKTDRQILDDINSRKFLSQAEIIDMGYMPHSQVCRWQKSATVLLLPLRKEPESAGILAGKYFEYLASGNAILAFGPEDGALEDALCETGSGRIYDWEEKDRLKTYIRELYACFRNGGGIKGEAAFPEECKELRRRKDMNVSRFSRRNLTREMAAVFDSCGFVHLHPH